VDIGHNIPLAAFGHIFSTAGPKGQQNIKNSPKYPDRKQLKSIGQVRYGNNNYHQVFVQ